MKCRDIVAVIEEKYPLSYAMEWDNVGLLVGRDDKDVKKIYIALDATDSVIDDAVQKGADMIVTHHPLIFSGLKRINNRVFPGRRILKLIRHDIICYAMHTNYDVCRMAQLSSEKMGFQNPQVLAVTCEEAQAGIGQIAEISENITLRECAARVKKVFGVPDVRVFGDPETVARKAAICPGSGKSVIEDALRKKADVLITGDIGHHEGIDAKDRGLCIIDAGHYGIEHIFIDDMKQYLDGALSGTEVITAPAEHPFFVL